MTSDNATNEFWKTELPELRGPWLGQDLPGDEPIEFCPEVLSTRRHSFCTAFSPTGDEFFFATEDPSTEISHLAWMKMVNGGWTSPRPAPFNSEWLDNDICMSPDGQRVCWRSCRPLPGNAEPEERSALWAADRTDGGWGEAFPITCGEEVQYSGYPGIASSGNVYFAGRRSESECCVYRATRTGNAYDAREPILCGMARSGDLCIAPDESFLIIACWNLPENNGDSDLYISFQMHDGLWTPLRNMGEPVNNELNENCPMISPDGKWFFFFRYDPKTKAARTYWVDAGIINQMKPGG